LAWPGPYVPPTAAVPPFLPRRYIRRLDPRISGPDERPVAAATRHAEVAARALPQDGIGNNS